MYCWSTRTSSSRSKELDHLERPLLDEKQYSQDHSANRQRLAGYHWLLCLLNCAIFFLSITLFTISGTRFTEQNSALKATSIYSPILDAISLPLKTVTFNGSFFLGPQPSPWRQIPNPTSDAAWEDFEDIKPMALTRHDILQMGKDPALVARYTDSYWHFGEDAYIGALDFFHQVHCLNMLRKEVFFSYNKSEETNPTHTEMDWLHLQHCVDMLMQHLLCTADTGMLTYKWMKDAEHPHPDMSVNRKCKDWRQLVEYRDRMAVDREKYLSYKKPHDAVEGEWPEEYKIILSDKWSHHDDEE